MLRSMRGRKLATVLLSRPWNSLKNDILRKLAAILNMRVQMLDFCYSSIKTIRIVYTTPLVVGKQMESIVL